MIPEEPVIRPFLLAIAGPSGSGKTALAQHLSAQLSGRSAIISLDAYYRDFACLSAEEKARFNFDAPEALDWELLLQHLETLASGQAVDRPVYHFATHHRAPYRERLMPARYLIVEGLFALYWAELRRLYRISVFVRADDHLCLARRLARDVAERGRTRESVLAQYESQVRPMYIRYVLPTQRYADLVVDGAAPVAENAAAILALLPN